MDRYLPIRKIHGREILDSRGNPTIEVEVTVGEGLLSRDCYTGRAMVPSGASTGTYEAKELRDKEARYQGMGVKKAVENVNCELTDLLAGENALDQVQIDRKMINADGTEDKSRLGGNAILGISLATAKAAAKALCLPLYQYIGGCSPKKIPIPMMNILNGGRHAANAVDFQEFMIMPVRNQEYPERLEMCANIYRSLKNLLQNKGLSTGVGDEGGFAPDLPDAETVLSIMEEAIIKAGYIPEADVRFALDTAASELYIEETGKYFFPGESRQKGKEIYRDTGEMIDYYDLLLKRFPIISIEDGLWENDWEGWKEMTSRLGKNVQLVGDDIFVTNKKKLKNGIRLGCGNAILIKPNQIGTLTEMTETVDMAHKHGYRTVISHRSGETADSIIADLAVGLGIGQIKTGAPCRGERIEKYNQLLRIYEGINR